MRNDVILRGVFLGGEIEPGTFHGGEIEPGTFHGGEIEPGTFHGGEIEPGTFHGGEIEPGTFHGVDCPDIDPITRPIDEESNEDIEDGSGYMITNGL